MGAAQSGLLVIIVPKIIIKATGLFNYSAVRLFSSLAISMCSCWDGKVFIDANDAVLRSPVLSKGLQVQLRRNKFPGQKYITKESKSNASQGQLPANGEPWNLGGPDLGVPGCAQVTEQVPPGPQSEGMFPKDGESTRPPAPGIQRISGHLQGQNLRISPSRCFIQGHSFS